MAGHRDQRMGERSHRGFNPSRGECLGHGVKIEAGRGAGHEGRFAVHRMARKCAP